MMRHARHHQRFLRAVTSLLLLLIATPSYAPYGYDEKLKKEKAEPNVKPLDKVVPVVKGGEGTPVPSHPAYADYPSDPLEPGRKDTRGDSRPCAVPTNTCKMFCLESTNQPACLQRCLANADSCAK